MGGASPRGSEAAEQIAQGGVTMDFSTWAAGAVINDSGHSYVTELEELGEALAPLQESPVIYLDTETTGLDPLTDRIRLIQIGSESVQVLLDLFALGAAGIEAVRPILGDASRVVVLHNAKFDLKFLLQAGVHVPGRIWDTMLAHQLLHAGENVRHSLASVALRYLGESISKEEQASDWGAPFLTHSQLNYAAEDIRVLVRLRAALKPHLTAAGLFPVFKLESEAIPAIAAMELAGLSLDPTAWPAVVKASEDALALAEGEAMGHLHGFAEIERAREYSRRCQVEDEARALALSEGRKRNRKVKPPPAFSLGSPAQLLKVLRHIEPSLPNTAKSTLKARAHIPAVRAVLEFRQADTFLNAFGHTLPDKRHPATGRIHASYNQLGAKSGRFSCSKPNLQQIPNDQTVRRCFVPAEGNKFVVSDYSQMELRILAEISNDTVMLRAYDNGEDLHTVTASLAFSKSLTEVTKQERSIAKSINFGLAYGMGAASLRSTLSINCKTDLSLSEVEDLQRACLGGYKGFAEWQQSIAQSKPLELRTLSGRRLLLDSPRYTLALNFPIQGTGADICKVALTDIYNKLNQFVGAKLIACVHDEIILEAPEKDCSELSVILQDCMVKAGQKFLKRVLVEADANVCDSWADK